MALLVMDVSKYFFVKLNNLSFMWDTFCQLTLLFHLIEPNLFLSLLGTQLHGHRDDRPKDQVLVEQRRRCQVHRPQRQPRGRDGR